MITKIATQAVYVTDQKEARKFWTEQVGFVIKKDLPMGKDSAWIEVGPKEAESSLVIFPKAMMEDYAERKPSIVFSCDDVNKTYKELSGRGVTFTEPPKEMPWGPFAIFVDAEGNWYGLKED